MDPKTGLDGCEKSPPNATFSFLHSLYFIRSSVPIVLAFAFCLYCTTHTTQIPMPPAAFEPATRARDQPQILALYSSATWIGKIPGPSARSKSL